jgi:cysteine desulfurase
VTIYLDHHATTPCDPRVVEAMQPYWSDIFGNPASRTHDQGRQAYQAIERARAQVAALIGASPKEIVFTSGTTEAVNLAIQGVWQAAGRAGHLVASAFEHPAVLETVRALEADGAKLTLVPVTGSGVVEADQVARAIQADTRLVAVMGAQNEIGTLQPVAEIGARCRERGVPYLCDAAQLVGKRPVAVGALSVDLLAFSAHKLYGPKGAGALWVRRRPPLGLSPIQHGGGHERGLRAGTANVPGLVGFGAACALAGELMDAEARRLEGLRDRLEAELAGALPGVHVTGRGAPRLPHSLHVAFEQVEGRRLIEELPELAVSSGSACTSDRLEPSHVLRALGLPDALAYASLRIGLGRGTTEDEVARAGRLLVDAVSRIRAAP